MIKDIIRELETNKTVFEALLVNSDIVLHHWKQDKEKWSLLEILCHLYDEEREDFRFRLNHILKYPKNQMPPIHPEKWVELRKYKEEDFDKRLSQFLEERSESINWLKSLENPKWDNSYSSKSFGEITAKMMLYEWLAHDYLHIRQITKLKYDYYRNALNTDINYAGEW